MIDLQRSNSILTSRASAQAVQIAEGLRFATLQEVIDQLRGSRHLPNDVRQHFIDLLTTQAEGALRSAADNLASEALSLGRLDEATIFKDDIETATYTALLDENTCDPCADADGTEVEFGSPEYARLSPPYQNCEGRNRCRCQFVFTLKTEAPGGPVPITPLRPISPYPPVEPAGPFPPRLPTPITPRPRPAPPPPVPPVAPPRPPVAVPPPPAPVPPPVAVVPPTPPVVPPAPPIVPPTPPVVPPVAALPPLAPKGADPIDELAALRARIAQRDLNALTVPIPRDDEMGFAKAYLFPDRKVMLIHSDEFPLGTGPGDFAREVRNLGFTVRAYKDVIVVLPAKYGGTLMRDPELTALAALLYKRRRGSALTKEVLTLAGYSDEHIAEMERVRALRRKLSAPAGPRPPAPPLLGPAGSGAEYTPRAPLPVRSIGIVSEPTIPAMPAITKKAEAEAWIAKTFPHLDNAPKVTISEMRLLSEGLAELNRMNAIFPRVGATFRGIGTVPSGGFNLQGRGRVKRFNPAEWAHVTRFQGSSAQQFANQQGLGLRPGAWDNAQELLNSLDMSERQGFHPPGASTPASIITHEFGHAIDNYLTWHQDDVLNDGRIVRDIVARYRPFITGAGRDPGSTSTLRASVSGYAARAGQMGGNGDAETFAEAFASLSWTPENRLSQPAQNLRLMLEELDKGGFFR